MSSTPQVLQSAATPPAADLGTAAGVGTLTGNNYNGANAAPAAITPAPASGTSPLQPNPDAGEAPGGVVPAPGSMGDKLSAALAAIGSHPNAPAAMAKPGGWARAMLGGVMTALSGNEKTGAPGVGRFFTNMEGARGPLGSLGSALGQNADRVRIQKMAADKAAQEKTKEAQEQETHDVGMLREKQQIATSNAQMIHEQALTHQVGEDAINASIASGKQSVETLKGAPSPGSAVAEDVTSDDVQKMIQDGTFKSTEMTAYPTGRRQEGENSDHTPKYRTTYTVMSLPKEVPIGKDEAADMSKWTGRTITDGQILSGADYNALKQQAENNRAATAARDKALIDAKLATAEQAHKMDAVDISPVFNNAMSDAMRKGASISDAPVAALKTLQARAAQDPEFAKRYPNLTQSVKDAYGDKNWDSLVEEHQKHVDRMAEEWQKEQEKKDLAGDYKGDQSLSGPAYLASLSPAERGIVQGIGTAQLPLNRMEYLAARKPEVLEAVMQAYPGFQGSSVAAYVDNVKNYTNTSPNKTGGQLAAGAIALGHLKRLMDINNAHPLGVHMGVGKTQTAAAQEYDNLLDTVADELVTFYAEPKTNEAIASKKKTLGATINRNAAIMEQAKAMGVRFDELESRWNDAIPSDAYRKPMPNVSPLAKQNRAVLDPEYSERLKSQQSGQPASVAQPSAAPQQPPSTTHMQKPDGTYVYVPNALVPGLVKAGGKVIQ